MPCSPLRINVDERGTSFHHRDTETRRTTLKSCHPEPVRRRRTGEGPYDIRVTYAVNGIHDGVRGEDVVVLHNAVESAAHSEPSHRADMHDTRAHQATTENATFLISMSKHLQRPRVAVPLDFKCFLLRSCQPKKMIAESTIRLTIGIRAICP